MHLKPLPRALISALALLPPSLPVLADDDTTADPGRVLDKVEVVAHGTVSDVPDTLSTDVIDWHDSPGAPVHVQDLLVRIPGVGATGQNGAFETFSIRGSTANCILVLF